MTVRVGINGFGRMGRLGFRVGWDNPGYEITHVNEIAGDAACMAHLLTFDSVHGRWDRLITTDVNTLRVDGKPVGYSMHKTPGEIDWAGMGIELVIECSGKFKTREALQPYFDQGVKKVLVSAPVPDPAIFMTEGTATSKKTRARTTINLHFLIMIFLLCLDSFKLPAN